MHAANPQQSMLPLLQSHPHPHNLPPQSRPPMQPRSHSALHILLQCHTELHRSVGLCVHLHRLLPARTFRTGSHGSCMLWT